jgi:hypothetical protein
MVMEALTLFGPLLILLFFIFLGFFIFLLVFWIWMLVDCLTRDFKEGSERLVWVIVIVFLSLLGALLYYLLVFLRIKKKRRR